VKTLFTIALAAFAVVLYADPVDDYVNAEMKKQNVPGLTLEIVKDGKVIKRSAYGKADLELDVPANIDNIFEIGSITKQFTATLVLMMADEGKLGLEDPISKYIEGSPATWSGITLRNMLNHQSGLKEYVAVEGLGLTEEYDHKTFIDKMKPLPLDFAPGTTFAYSNTNFALLGIVLEKVSGKSYTDLIGEKIFKPLGMDHTRILDPDAIIPNRAHGYMNIENTLYRTRQSMLSNISDGAILSTVDDMVKWDAALTGGKLLKPESYKLMTSPGVLKNGRTRPYGFGTFMNSLGGTPFVGHHGNSPGYSAGYEHFTIQNLTVILMANVYAINGQGWAAKIAEIIDPSIKVVAPSEKPETNPARLAQLKLALAALAADKADETLLEPEITAPMQTDRAKMFPGTYSAFKQIDKMTFLGEEPHGSDTLLIYRIDTPQRSYNAWFVWTPANKLSEVVLRLA
jgi:CubicO group peptidase (beta-lactamase class C family)